MKTLVKKLPFKLPRGYRRTFVLKGPNRCWLRVIYRSPDQSVFQESAGWEFDKRVEAWMCDTLLKVWGDRKP